jgi:hypothetical protein
MHTFARGRAGSGQGIAGNFRSALSQRREFQGKEDSGVGLITKKRALMRVQARLSLLWKTMKRYLRHCGG